MWVKLTPAEKSNAIRKRHRSRIIGALFVGVFFAGFLYWGLVAYLQRIKSSIRIRRTSMEARYFRRSGGCRRLSFLVSSAHLQSTF
jgi:hypothetical protein